MNNNRNDNDNTPTIKAYSVKGYYGSGGLKGSPFNVICLAHSIEDAMMKTDEGKALYLDFDNGINSESARLATAKDFIKRI